VLASSENIEIPWTNLAKPDFKDGEIPSVTVFTAFFRSLVEGAVLPYRLWRYTMYDQTYHQEADGAEVCNPDEEQANPGCEPAPPPTPRDWAAKQRQEKWAAKIGLTSFPAVPSAVSEAHPIVAIVDSGVDYNHPAIHDLLWLNPAPTEDSRGMQDRYGWDFVSGDSKPFDDHYHGTEVASLVTTMMPESRIMALKVFNPWGITNYEAVKYAADHGAKIIVCAWATRQRSRALELATEYARAKGAVIVTAAGDRGDDLAKMAAYPAVLSDRYDNVVSVASVDLNDKLVQASGHFSNFSSRYVTIAAPGDQIVAGEPRNRKAKVTSTSAAAAIVAGALARIQSASAESATYIDWIQKLKADADRIPALETAAEGGLRLKVRE
jgi:hypothetical protein